MWSPEWPHFGADHTQPPASRVHTCPSRRWLLEALRLTVKDDRLDRTQISSGGWGGFDLSGSDACRGWAGPRQHPQVLQALWASQGAKQNDLCDTGGQRNRMCRGTTTPSQELSAWMPPFRRSFFVQSVVSSGAEARELALAACRVNITRKERFVRPVNGVLITMPANAGSRTESSHEVSRSGRRLSTETKSAFKTTELIAYIGAVSGVIVVSYLVKSTHGHADYFRADKAMFFIVLLTLGYLGSRGMAKSGSRDRYDD